MRLWIKEFRGSRVAVSVEALSEPITNVKQVVASATNVAPEEQGESVFGSRGLVVVAVVFRYPIF